MAAYAQFGPGFHPPPTQFLSRSGLQMPPSLTTHVISGGVVSVGAGIDCGLGTGVSAGSGSGSIGGGNDGGAQSPVATTSSAPSTSPPLTVGRTDSAGGILGCSSGNNSNSSGSGATTQCGGGTPTPELVQSQNQSTTTPTTTTAATVSANDNAICRSKALQPTESALAYPYQSCNTSISTATLQPSISCCDNGRPVMTDPVSGQMICSCQYDPTRFTALSNYTRIQSAAGIGVYGTPYPSNEQNPYPSIGVESPPFYSSVTHPYALKDNTGGADVTPWTSGGLQTSASYYTYDPTFGAYGYGASYDLAARRKNATRESTATLKAWLNEHKKNPYPTKGEKIMLAIITKMTLTQVSTWFANARRRLKKENKMTWEPKNRTEEEDDTLVSDEEKDHDDNNKATTTTPTKITTAAAAAATTIKQPSSYSYDAKAPLSNGVGASAGADPAAIACAEASVGGSNACVVNSPAVSLNKYNTGTNTCGGSGGGGGSIGGDTTAAVPSEQELASIMTSAQTKDAYEKLHPNYFQSFFYNTNQHQRRSFHHHHHHDAQQHQHQLQHPSAQHFQQFERLQKQALEEIDGSVGVTPQQHHQQQLQQLQQHHHRHHQMQQLYHH